eukprot:COSAG01_NODE_1451_length_10269_cov_16.336578_11_plen_93_part_00
MVFSAAYAGGMFFMGHIADRSNIRLFLGMCMCMVGVLCFICGVLQLADCASLSSAAMHPCGKFSEISRLRCGLTFSCGWWRMQRSLSARWGC